MTSTLDGRPLDADLPRSARGDEAFESTLRYLGRVARERDHTSPPAPPSGPEWVRDIIHVTKQPPEGGLHPEAYLMASAKDSIDMLMQAAPLTMKIDVLTLFPGMFAGPLDESIVQRARSSGVLDLRVHNLRDYTEDRHRTVDDRPFGGGPGMLLKPEPLFKAVQALARQGTRVRTGLHARADQGHPGEERACSDGRRTPGEPLLDGQR